MDELNGPDPITMTKVKSIRFYVGTVLIAVTVEYQGAQENDVVFSSILVDGAVDFFIAAPPELKDSPRTVWK